MEQIPRNVVLWFMASCCVNYKQLIVTATQHEGFFEKDLKADWNSKVNLEFLLEEKL